MCLNPIPLWFLLCFLHSDSPAKPFRKQLLESVEDGHARPLPHLDGGRRKVAGTRSSFAADRSYYDSDGLPDVDSLYVSNHIPFPNETGVGSQLHSLN
jgi:hypothetical protein